MLGPPFLLSLHYHWHSLFCVQRNLRQGHYFLHLTNILRKAHPVSGGVSVVIAEHQDWLVYKEQKLLTSHLWGQRSPRAWFWHLVRVSCCITAWPRASLGETEQPASSTFSSHCQAANNLIAPPPNSSSRFSYLPRAPSPEVIKILHLRASL